VITGSADLETVLALAPEWEQLLRNWQAESRNTAATEFLNRVGAKAIHRKLLSLTSERERFLELLQTAYYQPMLQKMLNSNQNLRRFLAQRHVASDEHKGQVISFAAELSTKMKGTLIKQLSSGEEDGFKVLLPAYVQRSVHNAVIDYIRNEASWEKHTLQDVYLDPQGEDPRTSVADDLAYTPEHKVLSGEQVTQLNELRRNLEGMLADPKLNKEPLTVVDCMFGLGLTGKSVLGEEMTMREVCDKLEIQGETLARRIAKCQVLLDKGMEMVRNRIYKDMPGIAECWQRGVNVNTASRRELAQQLGMTEGEIERCIKARQISRVEELQERQIVKDNRLQELVKKGAVAAFVPVDLNSATARDITDVVGVPKEQAQRLVSERPFKDIEEIVSKKLASKDELALFIRRGAVVKAKFSDNRRVDLNRAPQEDLVQLGVDPDTASVICKTRPFGTWGEVEEFLGTETPSWAILRQRFFLGLTSG
jgi:DNA uptake protein ComE-like DNA-binding protein